MNFGCFFKEIDEFLLYRDIVENVHMTVWVYGYHIVREVDCSGICFSLSI